VETFTVTGAPCTLPRVIELLPGWQLFGSSCEETIPLDAAAIPAHGADNPGDADRVLAWDPVAQRYTIAWFCTAPWGEQYENRWLTGYDPTPIQLEPGQGYWYQNRGGTITWTYHCEAP
jgi:hypothetical protein